MRRRELAVAFASDKGRERENNEDLPVSHAELGVFAVIDGVGGEAAGEEAAAIARRCLHERFSLPSAQTETRIREAITSANNAIFAAAQRDPSKQGMSCVLTVAVVEEEQLTIGHVGDSRLYLLKPGHIQQVTRDHSAVGEEEKRGELTEAEAMADPRRSEIYRDVGSELRQGDDPEFIDIYVGTFPRHAAILLCSDGLSDMLPREEIRRLVEQHAENPPGTVKALVAAANEAGGKDNITVVLVLGEEYAGRLGRSRQPKGAKRKGTIAPAPVTRTRFRRLMMAAAALLVIVVLAQQLLPPLPEILERMFASETNQAAVLRVGKAGADYASISEAVAAARPGQTIVVEPGDYIDRIELKQGVRLISQATRQARLHAKASGAGQPTSVFVGNGIQGASIEGFVISGNATYPLKVGVSLSNSTVDLVDLEISGAEEAAVDIVQGGPFGVTGCFLHDNPGHAIRISGPNTQWVSDNRILRNGIGRRKDAAPAAIAIRGASFPRLTGNQFEGNAGEEIEGLAPSLREEFEARNTLVGRERHGPGGGG